MSKKIKPIRKASHYHFVDHPEFQPNISPIDVIKQGAFGGTYFRPIYSQVTQKNYPNRHSKYFSKYILQKNKIDPKTHLTKPFPDYDKKINKYQVKCGQTLEQWESKNWITKHDPYGWFEWYCNFFQGRRLEEEDKRQIDRWLKFAGPKGRFSQRLRNMVKKNSTTTNPTDPKISPVIRQSLLHWGFELNEYTINPTINPTI